MLQLHISKQNFSFISLHDVRFATGAYRSPHNVQEFVIRKADFLSRLTRAEEKYEKNNFRISTGFRTGNINFGIRSNLTKQTIPAMHVHMVCIRFGFG